MRVARMHEGPARPPRTMRPWRSSGTRRNRGWIPSRAVRSHSSRRRRRPRDRPARTVQCVASPRVAQCERCSLGASTFVAHVRAREVVVRELVERRLVAAHHQERASVSAMSTPPKRTRTRRAVGSKLCSTSPIRRRIGADGAGLTTLWASLPRRSCSSTSTSAATTLRIERPSGAALEAGDGFAVTARCPRTVGSRSWRRTRRRRSTMRAAIGISSPARPAG